VAIYIWFVIWMFLLLAMAAGAYALLARLMSPAAVQWLLLPGTIVSEVAYMFGMLITGGEIRRRVLPDASGGGAAPSGGGKYQWLGETVASLLSVVAVAVVLVTMWTLLDKPVIGKFIGVGITQRVALAPLDSRIRSGPSSAGDVADIIWDQAHNQVSLLRRLAGTLTELDWFAWRTPLFVYLTLCLSIRLWPSRRPIRPTLLAVVILAGVIAAVGAIWNRFESLLEDIWPLLTYVWTSLLLALVLTLLITGVVMLVRVLSGKSGQAKPVA